MERLSGTVSLMLVALLSILLGTVWMPVAVGLCGVTWKMESERRQTKDVSVCEFVGKSRFYPVITVRRQHDRISLF